MCGRFALSLLLVTLSTPTFISGQRAVDSSDSVFYESYFSRNRIYFECSPNWHNYQVANARGDYGFLREQIVMGLNAELGMEFSLKNKMSVSMGIGHGIFQHSFHYEVKNVNIPGWIDTYWNRTNFDFVNFWTLSSRFSKYWVVGNRSLFSISGGVYIRLFLHHLNRSVGFNSSIIFISDEGQVLGNSSMEFDARLSSPVSVNPTLQAKYSLVNKKETTIGIGLIAAIPLFKVVTGTMTVFPEYPEKASYDFRYRGGFIGLSLTISNIPRPPKKRVRVNFRG